MTKEEIKIHKLTQSNTILNRDKLDKSHTYIKNIKKDYKDKTFIVISHRYENNDLYDKVINLEVNNGN
jgi:hypothetical protein